MASFNSYVSLPEGNNNGDKTGKQHQPMTIFLNAECQGFVTGKARVYPIGKAAEASHSV